MEQLEGSGLFQVQSSLDAFVRVWFGKIAPTGLLKYLLQIFHRLSPWVCFPIPGASGDIQTRLTQSADRLVLHTRKWLGILARILFAFIPCWFQRALGYSGTMSRDSVSEETLRTLVNPCGKASKRKQDDLALEEHECWVETLQKELPDKDDPEDLPYEPTKPEIDSEEYKSQNDTETDLEVEEDEDGMVMLKEYKDQKEVPAGEGHKAAAAPPETKADGGETLSLRTSGDGIEDPGWWVLKFLNESMALESQAGTAPQSQGPVAQHVLGTDKPASISSLE